jgi:large subunit ribosomal protein L10
LKREDKRKVVGDLNQRMRQSKVAILTRFVGLNVEKMTQLRRELRKAAVEYRIIKNTLMRLAVQGTDKEALTSKLEGPVAVAWSNADPVAPARVLAKFAKDFSELQILVAYCDGRLWGPAEIQQWVNLPGLEELRGKLVGLIQAPVARLVRLLGTPSTRVVQVMKAKSEQS